MPIRKIKPGYLNSTGVLKSQKNGVVMQGESSLEMDFIFLIEQDQSVDWYDVQPLEVPYIRQNGKDGIYTPDLLARYVSSSNKYEYVLYEVKYSEDLKADWAELKPKFKGAILFCKERGWRFKIMNENRIRTPHFKNLEFLFHFSRSVSQMEEELSELLMASLERLKIGSAKEILALSFNSDDKRREAAPVLWRLLHEGEIAFDKSTLITMESDLWIPET